MKDINEQVGEILNSKVSRTSKRLALVKIGLSKTDVDNLMFMTKVAAQTKSGFKFTFGVEIECFVNRYAVCRKMMDEGIRYAFEGYNHVDRKDYYKFVTDASVQGLDNPIECVSPVLDGKKTGYDSIKKTCDALNASGAKVNKTCGLHVHIGTPDGFTDQQYVNVFVNYAYLERAIDSFMAASRRGNANYYAMSLKYKVDDLCWATDKYDVREALDGKRYYKVNPVSIYRHGTIEFRQHQGTTDPEKVTEWVKFCAALVEWSKDNRLDRYVTSVDEIPFLSKEQKAFFNSRVRELN